MSDFLNLEPPIGNTNWPLFFDCSTRYPTPTVQTPKDGAWGASYQRSGFIPGSLVQMRQNLKQMEPGCNCCWGCCLFLVVVLVVGCWWWWLDVGVVFCLSILFNWNLPLQIILKIISCTDVMRHHSSLEPFFVIIHVCSFILIIIFIIIIIIVHILHMTFMIIVKLLFMSISMC